MMLQEICAPSMLLFEEPARIMSSVLATLGSMTQRASRPRPKLQPARMQVRSAIELTKWRGREIEVGGRRGSTRGRDSTRGKDGISAHYKRFGKEFKGKVQCS